MTTPTKTVDEILLERVVFIGKGSPQTLTNDTRQMSVFLGTPNDIITAIRTLVEKAFDEVIGRDHPLVSKSPSKLSYLMEKNDEKSEARQRAKVKLTEMFGEEE